MSAQRNDELSGGRLVLIVNPRAAAHSERLPAALATILRRRYDVEIAESESPEHATEISRRAAAHGAQIVAALGGDGSARSVAEGIARTAATLACLPAGSRNVFARMIGLPGDPIECARWLAGAPARTEVDVGVVAGRRFLFTASVGLSARINREVNRRPRLKRRIGALYGAGVGVATAAGYLIRPPRMRVLGEGVDLRAISLVIQNGRHLTYVGSRPLELSERASHRSGTISLVALRGLRALDLLTIPVRLLLGGPGSPSGHSRLEEVGGLAEARIESAGSRELPVDLDGDHAGSFRSIGVGVEPAALSVIPGPGVEAGAGDAAR